MKNYLFFLIFLSVSSQAARFPAEYVCDNGDTIRLTLQGAQQRLIYTSEKYGTHSGTLDVFKGKDEHKNEVIGSVFSLDVNAGHPIAFSLQIKTIGDVFHSVIYNYRLYPDKEESGDCIPIKNGLVIEGDK